MGELGGRVWVWGGAGGGWLGGRVGGRVEGRGGISEGDDRKVVGGLGPRIQFAPRVCSCPPVACSGYREGLAIILKKSLKAFRDT